MKKIISILLALILLATPIYSYADDSIAVPYYLHIRSMAHFFDIDTQTGYAMVDAHMSIKSGDSCSVNATVKREINGAWRNVIAYNDSGDTSATISRDPYLSEGYKYKCVFTFTVYDANENILEQRSFESREIEYT